MKPPGPPPASPSATAWRATPLLLVAALLAACETIPRTTIDAEDDSVLFPTGRISWQLEARDSEPAEDEPAAARTRTALELDVGYGSGESTQQLRDGQVVQVGGTALAGPGPILVSADLWNADLAGRMERLWPSGLGLGGRVGLRYSSLDLTLRSGSDYAGASDGTDLSSLGFLAGVEGFYEPVERLRLFVAGSLSWGLELSGVASGYEEITLSTLDLGAAWTLGRHVRLLGGWRRVGYEADSVEDYLSDLELVLSGPFLGLWVTL